jgi:chromosome segregation ATPase
VPDHYAKLTRAVVEIGTQLRRLADTLTTPVADAADTARTVAADHQTENRALREKLEQRAQEAAAEMARLRERATLAEARASQLDDLLRVARDTSNRSEAERARAVQHAERAEEQRDQLAAVLDEVLGLFTPALVDGKYAFYQATESPIAPQDYQRWRSVLNRPAPKGKPLSDPSSTVAP